MELLLQFQFDLNSIRLAGILWKMFIFISIQIESISFEIIKNFDYCPTLNKPLNILCQVLNKHSKTKENVDRVTV